MASEPMIYISGKNFKINDLEPELKKLVSFMTECNEELQRIEEEIMIASTARNAFIASLKEEIQEQL